MKEFAMAAAVKFGAALFAPGFAPFAEPTEAVSASLAGKLDAQAVAFTMTAAKRRRLMMRHEEIAPVALSRAQARLRLKVSA